MIKKIILISVLLLFSIKLSSAKMYTWKDSEGVTHATDDLSNAPAEIQEKYAIPTEIIELPKPIKQTKYQLESKSFPIIITGERRNKNGMFFITNNFEAVKKKPYNYKYKWTIDGCTTFYTSRMFEDTEEGVDIIPKGCLPNGKFTQIIYK